MAIICRLAYAVQKNRSVGMGRKTWISISGVIWALAGFMLLYKGLRILATLPNQEMATWLVAGGLLVGFIKGRFVLSRTVNRISSRIASLPTPIHFISVYPKGYWILLSSMLGMGFLLRMVPADWHGFIDVAIGSALINGAILYFRTARTAVQ
jgi:hypothetical protein